MYTSIKMRTLTDDIAELKDQALSNDNITHAMKGDVSVILYTELVNHKNIRELFTQSNNVVLLFPVEARNYGHYVGLMYYPDLDMVSVFDPYGMSIYEDIKNSDYLMRQDTRVIESLPRLLKDSNVRVNVNRIRFQELKNGISTCGKHVIVRMIFRDILSHTDYKKYLKYKNLNPDDIVSLMFV